MPPGSIPPSATNPIPLTNQPSDPSLSSSSHPSSTLPPSPPKRRIGRFRQYLLALILVSGVGYAGGVYYSLVSDNFHDFFTEYVPFGEDAVLYFEEREYRKRFPNITNPTSRPHLDTGNKVTIPRQSGVSWRVADEEHQVSDLEKKGRHMSALEANKPGERDSTADAQRNPSAAAAAEKTKSVASVKKDDESLPSTYPPSTEKPKPASPRESTPKPAEKPVSKSQGAPAPQKPNSTQAAPLKSPEVDEPSQFIPMKPIDPLKIPNADEPLVQDLVKILNDIITVVNNDGSSHKYSSTITKAKNSLAGAGKQVIEMKQSEQKAATEKIQSMQTQFDNGAKELVGRLEQEIKAQEGRWRDEFDSEREKLVNSYQERLEAETKRAQEVADQRTRNELLRQAIALKEQFLSEVTSHVESERNGRLSKLSDLSSSLSELEKLSADWNSVVDANLKTQHLQVAVEAVRSSLENADRPRPFIRELAALKEISSDDSVINAAIASINPTAYQRGIPTSAQLIDRFRRVASEVRKASLLPEDAGLASHAASFVLSKFMFKKQGMTVGDDVESVLTRTETLLEEGDLDEAAREINTLDGWAKTLSWDWLSECRRVLEVRQAIDVIAIEARLEGLKVDG